MKNKDLNFKDKIIVKYTNLLTRFCRHQCLTGKKKRDGRIEALKKKYHYSQSQIYRIANDGIKHISLMMYGNY